MSNQLYVWDLFENKHMLDARNAKKDSNLHHLAEMVALLGMPPKDFLLRSDYASEFFDQHGQSLVTMPFSFSYLASI